MKDYYKIMGLKPTATEAEIKSAYRLLAKRYHPDVNPGNAAAAEKFAALSEAYDVLGDPTKKAAYDRQLAEAMRQSQYANAYAQQQHQQQQQAYSYGQSAYAQYARRNQYGAYAQQQQQAQQAQQAQYAHAQFVQQQMQAQQWMKKVADAQREGYTKGYEAGAADVRSRMGAESERLRTDLDAAAAKEAERKEETSRLKKRVDSLEADLEALKMAKSESEERLKEQIDKANRELESVRTDSKSKQKLAASNSATIKTLKEKLAAVQEEAEKQKKEIAKLQKELSEEKAQQFKKDKTITDLKLEATRLTSERNYYEEEMGKYKTLAEQKEEEIQMLNQTLAQWEDFSESLDTAEAMKSLKGQWDKQLRDVKKKLKSTHYGTLGVLYIATEDEIKESFRKLYKRYTKKAETDKSFEEKLVALSEAFQVLSDAEKRKAYNAEIGVTDEEIAEFAEAKTKHEANIEQLQEQQGEQEFWAFVEDLMYNAQTGDAESQNKLGEMYFSGEELDRDTEQAAYWFKEAAKSKYPTAFFNLGICFLLGEGVDLDPETGKGFVKQAAKLGCEQAQELIDAKFDLKVVFDPD